MKNILLLAAALLLPAVLFAADVCIDTVCDTTTARQDQGVLYVCELRKGSSCTANEARTGLVAEFMNIIEEQTQLRERRLAEENGINKAFLHTVAQEETLSLSTKCSVMADEGVQTQYESIYNVTCP